MYCRYCGSPLHFENQQFCSVCGAGVAQTVKKPSKVGAFVLSVLKGAGFYAMFYGMIMLMQSVYSAVVAGSLGGLDILDSAGYMGLSDAYWNMFSKSYAYVMFFSYILLAVVYWIVFAARRKSFTSEIGLKRTQFASVPAAFGFGVALQIVVVFIISYISVAIPSIAEEAAETEKVYECMFGNASTLSMYLATAVATPVIEEILFRGLIYTRMKKAMPQIAAMLLSAIWFGVAHSGGIHQIVYAAALGIIMVLLYEKYQSLWPCIFLHAGFNSTGFLYDYLDMNAPIVNWILLALSIGFTLVFVAYFFMSKPVYED